MKAVIGSEKDLDLQGRIFEPKLDGIRALCYVNEELSFYSRNGINITKKYPEFQFRDHIKAKTAILDGEIVVLDAESVPRFSLWQQGHEACYVVFDILAYNGKSLLHTPLIERKKILERVVTNGALVEKCLYTSNGHALWKEIQRRQMEGVMVKDSQSLYYPGKRRSMWLKVKTYKTLEAVIIGYTTKKRGISALILGVFTAEGALEYIGKVGTGFSAENIGELHKLFRPYQRARPPRTFPVKDMSAGTLKAISWLKPELVCEIKYLECTSARKVRSPVFLRMRPDKNAQEVTFEDQGICR